MRKEQNNDSILHQDPHITSTLSGSARITRKTSKNQKQIRKKRPRKICRTKTTASSETSLNSSASLSIRNQNDAIASSVPRSSVDIPFQSSLCLPLQVQNQTYSQLAQACQYLSNLSEHLFQKQTKFPLPQLHYSIRFGPSHRFRLIQLIILKCRRLNFSLETQFLAIDIFHRICTAQKFQRYHCALKAATSLYIAAKYEQVCSHEPKIFSNLDPYQRMLPQNIIKLEGDILIHLNFNLSFTTPLNFIELLSIKFQLNPQSRFALLQLCRRAICKQEIWMLRGSLLVMSCFETLFGRVKEWEEIGQLRTELDWRILILRQLLNP